MIRYILAASLVAFPAFAQMPGQMACGPRAEVEETLAGKYGESVRAYGVGRNHLFEFWGNEESGSWTITRTAPNGMTCLMADGNSFEAREPVVDPGDPA